MRYSGCIIEKWFSIELGEAEMSDKRELRDELRRLFIAHGMIGQFMEIATGGLSMDEAESLSMDEAESLWEEVCTKRPKAAETDGWT
jgi:hypothetical protein